MNYFNFILETAKETMRCYRGVIELYALSDEELSELGLTRIEIPSVVILACSRINNLKMENANEYNR